VRRALVPSAAFTRAAKRLVKRNPQAAAAIRETLTQLESDAFDPRLRTHKLKGELSDCWSASAAYDLRIVFQFVKQAGAESILLLSVGTHDQVY
jgi:addiction module RelE/StbE family toxin